MTNWSTRMRWRMNHTQTRTILAIRHDSFCYSVADAHASASATTKHLSLLVFTSLSRHLFVPASSVANYSPAFHLITDILPNNCSLLKMQPRPRAHSICETWSKYVWTNLVICIILCCSYIRHISTLKQPAISKPSSFTPSLTTLTRFTIYSTMFSELSC